MIIKTYKKFIIIALWLGTFLIHPSSSVPVIFIHSGDAFYLEDTLAQAKSFNDRVILIGDEKNKHCAQNGIEYYAISDFSQSADCFTKVYRHLSHIPYHIELACFTRWFIMQDFMKAQDIPLAFYADSDVMLYCDVFKEFKKNFRECDVAVSIQYGFCGGLVSYWRTHSIESFCNFLNTFYEDTERLNILEDQFKLGGEQFQDDWPQMTNWVHENNHHFNIGNLSNLINNTTFDSSIWHDYILVPNAAADIEYKRYRMTENYYYDKPQEKLMKDIIWNQGLPYSYSADLGIFVQFKGLHFQGNAKSFIKNYRSEKTDLLMQEPYKSIHTLPFYMLGFFSTENQKNLEDFITTYRPKTIVELGSWLGASTAFMGFFMPKDGKIYAVDHFDTSLDPYLKDREKNTEGNADTLYQQFLSNIRHYKLCNKVIPVKMNSLDAARLLDIKADLIYVDASIEEESVYQDIMAWYPKLNKNGIICGDNWRWFNSVRVGVARAAVELKRTIKVNENFWYFDLVNDIKENND